jgi:hypothetical protein
VCDAAYDQAQSFRDARKLVEARNELRVCARPMCPRSVVKDCAEWLADIEARMPSVVALATDPSGNALSNATVAIDGGPSRALDGGSWDINPGQHTFTFTGADGATATKSVLVAEAQKSLRVAVAMGSAAPILRPLAPVEDASSDARRSRHVAAGVVGGVGVAGVIIGGIFGGLTFSEVSSVNSLCRLHTNCSSTATNDRSRAVTDASVSDVALVAGGVLVVTAVTLWLTAPSPAPASGATAKVEVVPGGLRLRGTF